MPGKGGVLSPRSPFNGAAAFLAISSRSSCFLRCASTFAFSASISAGVPPSRSRGTAGASPRPASEVGTIGAPSLFAGAGGGTISKFSSLQLAVSSGCAATYSSIASSVGKVILGAGASGLTSGLTAAGASTSAGAALIFSSNWSSRMVNAFPVLTATPVGFFSISSAIARASTPFAPYACSTAAITSALIAPHSGVCTSVLMSS